VPVSPLPLMAGPMTNADNENITANTASPITGAHHVPNLRRSRSSNGTEAARPSMPNRAVPPVPVTRAVPATAAIEQGGRRGSAAPVAGRLVGGGVVNRGVTVPGPRPGLSAWRFVAAFGVVALLADVVYEGARSVAGPFLGQLGASALAVGVITGVGEAAALVGRLASGPLADRWGHPWRWTVVGYAVTVATVPALALAAAPVWAGVLIVAERVGKAVRAPAKDALLAHAGTGLGRGKAFAAHEILDQVGAFAGPLLVAAVLAGTGNLRAAFAVLAVPGVAALAVLGWLARRVPDPAGYEPPAAVEPGSPARHPPATAAVRMATTTGSIRYPTTPSVARAPIVRQGRRSLRPGRP
jgi:hypothetical protein